MSSLPLQLRLLLSDGKAPKGPTVDPILELHRGADSYVTFHKFREGKIVSDCSVKVDALANYFPEFRDELDRDAYFSLNSFYRAGRGTGMCGMPSALRNSASARYLNANFVDIDCHHGEFRFWELVGQVGDIQENDVIPSPSIFVRSGRGLWLLWILVDRPESELPPTAHAPRLLLWNAIQSELGRRLAEIGADCGALDVARISRVPGSINSNIERRVNYLFPSEDGKRGITYTMEQMSEFLQIEPPRMRYQKSPELLPSPRAITGHRALAQHRFADFLQLRELRGGFREGTRHNAALIFASILRANQFDDSTITKELAKFARECKPPLPHQQVSEVLNSSRTYRKMRDELIASRLQVTEEEGRIIPRWATRLSLPFVPTVETSPITRRQMILRQVAKSGHWPPCREMAATLRSLGIQVGHVTVSRDYHILQPRDALPLLEDETHREHETHSSTYKPTTSAFHSKPRPLGEQSEGLTHRGKLAEPSRRDVT
jgi:hypothetical protein